MTVPPWQFQRAYTPPLMKRLVQITCAVTLASVLFNLQRYLAISPDGYFWQPITSLFLLPAPELTFGFMLDFAFCMLVFWLFGSIVLERIGKKQFLIVYFLTGLLSGVAAATVMHKFQLLALTTSFLPMILSQTVLWAMIDPNQQILLFFVLPLRAKWVLTVALFGTIFLSFVQQDIINFSAYLVALVFSYIWGLAILGLKSPFEWMQGLDRLINKMRIGIVRFWQWDVAGRSRKKDEAFIDATLDKISKEGEGSLSFFTRLRLKWIALKKRIL